MCFHAVLSSPFIANFTFIFSLTSLIAKANPFIFLCLGHRFATTYDADNPRSMCIHYISLRPSSAREAVTDTYSVAPTGARAHNPSDAHASCFYRNAARPHRRQPAT